MGKYFKYAIGEILLVVIGILLALQINNWNENRKADIFEKNILKELVATIDKDIEFFNGLEKRIKNKDSAIDNLLYARAGKRTFTEEKLQDDIFWAGAGIIFSYNKGPYETLKSSGLDRIKTDSVRSKITNYYEVYLPRGEVFIHSSRDFYEPTIYKLRNDLRDNGFFEDYFQLIVEDSIEKGYAPRTKYNLSKFLNDPSYNEYLILNAQYKREIWTYIGNIISRSKKVSDVIKLELKERFNEDNL